MTWGDVLKRILEQPAFIPKSIREPIDATNVFKSPNLAKVKPALGDIKTDELAEYHPSSSPPKITYYVKRIAHHADNILAYTRGDLGIPPPTIELIQLFRLAFSHAIRRHEMFHYFVERGSMLMAEHNYREYRKRVYEEREKCGRGNLEEALADAYAIVRCSEDLKHLPEPKKLPYNREDLTEIFRGVLRHHFINCPRPPGYREARLFMEELEHLWDPLFITAIVIGLYGQDIWDHFKGISWLFFELSVKEPRNFTNYGAPAATPYSKRDFILFLDNFRHNGNRWLQVFLHEPCEEAEE
jgi:hypothetical protein